MENQNMENKIMEKYLIEEDNKDYYDWILRRAVLEKDPKKKYVIVSSLDFLFAVKASSNEKWIRNAKSIVERFVRSL